MKTETIRVKESDITKFLSIKEVPEELLDYVGVYELRSWSFGEREKLIGGSSTQTVTDTGKVKSVLDSSVFRIAVIKTCIRKCPLKSTATKKYIEDMPVWLGEALWDKVNSLNEAMDTDEGKKFKFS